MNPVGSSNHVDTQPLKINAIALVVQSVYILGWSYGIDDILLISHSSLLHL